MGITSCGSFNQPTSFLLTAIYFVHITILIGKRDTTCPIMPGTARGGTLPPVRFALVSPGSARLRSVKNKGHKATPALGVSEPFYWFYLHLVESSFPHMLSSTKSQSGVDYD